MNRDTRHKDVIIAFLNGEDIEFLNDVSGKWLLATSPLFDEKVEYRIKPKKKLRPLEGEELKNLVGNKILNKTIGTVSLVLSYEPRLNQVYTYFGAINAETLMDRFKAINGSPLGVEE